MPKKFKNAQERKNYWNGVKSRYLSNPDIRAKVSREQKEKIYSKRNTTEGRDTYNRYMKKYQRRQREFDVQGQMLIQSRYRARKAGIEHNLERADIKIPKRCPVIGIPLNFQRKGRMADNSPSLDRIDNDRGYIKGNIVVVSLRANRIKSNATIKELTMIARFYGRYK